MLHKFYSLGILIIFALLGFFFTTGCASKGTMQVHKEPPYPLGNYKILAVEVFSQPEDSEIKEQLAGLIIAKLREKEVFERVYSKSFSLEQGADLRLHVVIKSVRKINPVKRYFLAPFIGPGRLKVDIQIVDNKNNQTLATAQAEGET